MSITKDIITQGGLHHWIQKDSVIALCETFLLLLSAHDKQIRKIANRNSY